MKEQWKEIESKMNKIKDQIADNEKSIDKVGSEIQEIDLKIEEKTQSIKRFKTTSQYFDILIEYEDEIQESINKGGSYPFSEVIQSWQIDLSILEEPMITFIKDVLSSCTTKEKLHKYLPDAKNITEKNKQNEENEKSYLVEIKELLFERKKWLDERKEWLDEDCETLNIQTQLLLRSGQITLSDSRLGGEFSQSAAHHN